MPWPARIRRLRRRLGLTQVALAKRLGCAPNTVATWERGLYEPQKLMRIIVKALEKDNAARDLEGKR